MTNKIARIVSYHQAMMLATKNADAAPGKMWSLEANDYVDYPTCEPGYHWDINTYRCIPN